MPEQHYLEYICFIYCNIQSSKLSHFLREYNYSELTQRGDHMLLFFT